MPKHRMNAGNRLDVVDLFAPWAWSRDTGDDRGMAALFTEDGVMEGMDGRRFQGRAGIGGFCRELIGGPASCGTRHRCDATPDTPGGFRLYPLSARRPRAS